MKLGKLRQSERLRLKRCRINGRRESTSSEEETSECMSLVTDDLLQEIFIRLPDSRSVILCSSVCNRWFSVGFFSFARRRRRLRLIFHSQTQPPSPSQTTTQTRTRTRKTTLYSFDERRLRNRRLRTTLLLLFVDATLQLLVRHVGTSPPRNGIFICY